MTRPAAAPEVHEVVVDLGGRSFAEGAHWRPVVGIVLLVVVACLLRHDNIIAGHESLHDEIADAEPDLDRSGGCADDSAGVPRTRDDGVRGVPDPDSSAALAVRRRSNIVDAWISDSADLVRLSQKGTGVVKAINRSLSVVTLLRRIADAKPVAELEAVFATRGGPPQVLRMDNGFIESFNRRSRAEYLNHNRWTSLLEARIVIGDFKGRAQPQASAFGAGLSPPAEYAARCSHTHHPVACNINWNWIEYSPDSATGWSRHRGPVMTVERVLSDNGSCHWSTAWTKTSAELGIRAKRTRHYRSEQARRAALPAWLHTYNHHR
ncbi:integrase core domain-containing protein [Nocardia neocaledoniensis]|uniref:integrase core domain-containing protein n=1 Tax=Nocardia neocaledoniensis TaxID=236511 RepID=UPI003CC7CD49